MTTCTGVSRVNAGPKSEGAQRYPFIQKRLWQAVSPRPHLPIMVPLSSHSFKQWGQLGEILGGVRFPECGAHRSLADRPAWGSGVEYRQNKDIQLS